MWPVLSLIWPVSGRLYSSSFCGSVDWYLTARHGLLLLEYSIDAYWPLKSIKMDKCFIIRILLGKNDAKYVSSIQSLNIEICKSTCILLEIFFAKRNISPLGKIDVVKSLLLSKFTHLFISLSKPSFLWIRQLTKTLYKFIWGNKIEKISRKNICIGFNFEIMTNIETFIKSLKLIWFRKLFITNSSWISHWLQHYKTNPILTPILQTKSKFHTHFLFEGNIILVCRILRELWDEIFLRIIWTFMVYNNKIKIENKCTFLQAITWERLP
jgi:hypothetical protein